MYIQINIVKIVLAKNENVHGVCLYERMDRYVDIVLK